MFKYKTFWIAIILLYIGYAPSIINLFGKPIGIALCVINPIAIYIIGKSEKLW